MRTMRLGIITAAVCIVSVMLLCVGCEDDSADNTITVTPPSVMVTNSTVGHVITFEASLPSASTNSTRQLYFPLQWSVSNPALGSVLSATGNSAIYVTALGQYGPNVITVRDQAGSEGSAAITQSAQ